MYIIVIGLLKKLVICVTYCTNKNLCMKQIIDRSKINLPSKIFITCSIYIHIEPFNLICLNCCN